MFTFFLIFGLVYLLVFILQGAGPLLMGGVFLLSIFFSLLYISSFVSAWFVYVVFLVYVGGLLVLFSYMCALSLNENLDVNNKSFFFVVELILFNSYMFFSCWDSSYYASVVDGKFVDVLVGLSFNLGVLGFLGFCWVVFMVCLLFFVMVLVVKVCRAYIGPLRLLLV